MSEEEKYKDFLDVLRGNNRLSRDGGFAVIRAGLSLSAIPDKSYCCASPRFGSMIYWKQSEDFLWAVRDSLGAFVHYVREEDRRMRGWIHLGPPAREHLTNTDFDE